MTEFRCLVVTSEGRSNWRRVEAADQRRALALLAADGIVPIELRSGPMGLVERLNQPVNIGFGSGMGIAEQALIIGQLATLVKSGLPIDRSLDLLREQASKSRQRAMLGDVLSRIRGGSGLAAALEAIRVFPAYAIGVIRSAERSGSLAEALRSLAARMTLASATRRQLVTALTYPAAVLAATLISLVLVLTIVVPQFAPIFAGQEAKLPQLTRIVLALSTIVTRHGWTALATLVAVPTLLWIGFRTLGARAFMERIRHRIPGSGLRDQYLAAQFTGLMAVLIMNGVKVVNALALARSASSSVRWRTHIERVEVRVREGMRLSAALSEASFMPRTAIRLIDVGERSGKLAETCQRASEIMGEAAQARIERIVALANPIAIIGLGGIVAMLVAGVMLGIFSLGDFVE